jgi:hypothetical protein
MSDYVVCKPSYQLAKLCNEKTLATLKHHRVPASKIYVYVANQEEHDEYKGILDPALYHKLVIGKKGIVEQRRFIKENWPTGKHIVSFDDDVAKIDMSLSGLFRGKTLDYFIQRAFQECKKQKAFIWGVYPVYNPFFRKGRPEISTCLTDIVGCIYGYINRPTVKALNTPLTAKFGGQKEDVELSIKYFIHDGIVLRFNRIGFETKYYGTSGGLGRFNDRLKPMLEASKVLKREFPEYGEIGTRKSGMTEFRLKRIPCRVCGGGDDDATTVDKVSTKKTAKKQTKQNKTQKKRGK